MLSTLWHLCVFYVELLQLVLDALQEISDEIQGLLKLLLRFASHHELGFAKDTSGNVINRCIRFHRFSDVGKKFIAITQNNLASLLRRDTS